MKQNKGFTLAELLGVIAVLAIIILITVPFVNRYIDNSRNKSYETTMKTLKKASEGYILKNASTLAWVNDVYALNLTELKNSEFIANEDIYNPKKPNELLNGCMMIIRSNSKYYYEYSDTCTINANTYTNGTAIYFNPEKGTKCTQTEAESTTGYRSGCLKWYTFGDTGTTSSKINLILDHNTTNVVAYNSLGVNTSNASLMNALIEDTSSWINEFNPRIITASEVASIVNHTTFTSATTWFYLDTRTTTRSTTCTTGNLTGCLYGWLYDRTSTTCSTYGCLNNADSLTTSTGYWTATPSTPLTTSTFIVTNLGSLNVLNVSNATTVGVRPVITVNKN